MAVFKIETKNKVDIDKKPRVYFTCHPDDFEKYFKKICDDIFKTHDCAIYYTEDMTEFIAEDEKEVDLGRNNLFVVPVTFKLLTTPNRTMDADIPYALVKHIPVLPILMELVDDELYSSKFGELQYLNPLSEDRTEVPYEEKLKKYLESLLFSKELTDRIRNAFYAYIFLSYRKVDRVYANTLMRLIHSIPECRDFAIWFDEFLTPGESFKANIEKALDDCKLFTFLVTERLLKKNINKNGEEENNFVMAEELPKAKGKRAKKGTKIIAVEMEDAGKDAPSILEADDYIRYDDLEFRDRILATISKIKYDAVNTPEHTFLMGLAYLEGIDMEVDRERAVALIENAAESDLAEAMEKLIRMYKDGAGVARNDDAVQKWSNRLADYYYTRIFSQQGTMKSKKKLLELFSHYEDEYWAKTIKAFLVYADDCLTEDVIIQLYDLLMHQDICEYTLFFEACKKMQKHREETQCILLRDILQKSAEGIYPPYGPLFWYVPEHELYESLLLTLVSIINESYFTKALALARDVCWIFGRYNTTTEITDRVNGTVLFVNANLVGVRRGLCELFFTGDTAETCGDDVYPRCFNVLEAKSFKNTGCGIYSVMQVPFEDELDLYSHIAYNILNDEYIGLVSCTYDITTIETKLNEMSCRKVRGLSLAPSELECMIYASFNRNHIEVVYIPENIRMVDEDWNVEMPLIISVLLNDGNLLYFTTSVIIPDGVKDTDFNMVQSNKMLESVFLPKEVSSIGFSAFAHCTNLSKVILNEGLEFILDQAFYGCEKLFEIVIPDGTIAIGSGAFQKCTSLKKITLPKSIEHIECEAFKDCVSLDSIIVSPKVIKLNSSVFYGCRSLTSVILSGNLKSINNYAFGNCSNLANIDIPENLENIEAGAFSGCSLLCSIEIPKKIDKIESYTFKDCINLRSVIMSENIIEIGAYAFSGCKSLSSITLPDSLKKIARFAFSDCVRVTTIKIPNSVEVIERNAFKGCTNLSEVIIPSHLSKDITSALGEQFEGIVVKISNDFQPHIDEYSRVLVEQTRTFIEPYAYADNSQLKNVVIPYGIDTVGKYAFLNCKNLENIVFPESLITIGEGAFEGCKKIQTIVIKQAVEICGNAFCECSSLSAIELPCGLKTLWGGIFRKCINLGSVTLPKDIQEISMCTFEDCYELTTINFPPSLKKICSYAFKNCRKLTTVRIPNDQKEIEEFTFFGCESLLEVELPYGLRKICKCAFSQCKNFEKLIIPETVVEIGERAFEGCEKISSINIPVSIKKIGDNAFRNCSYAERITISARFEDDIQRIFGDVDSNAITFI